MTAAALYKHKKNGMIYELLMFDNVLIQIEGNWIEGVCYTRVSSTPDPAMYVRTLEDFERSFEEV